MASTGTPQFLRHIFSYQSNGGGAKALNAAVRQDKVRTSSVRVARKQPVLETKRTRTGGSGTKTPRTHKRSIATTNRVLVGVWVKPRVKAELQRQATTEGLSVSAVAAARIEEALQHSLSATYAPLLEPVITQAITKNMRGIATRLSWILVRVAFDSGQTRAIATNILGKLPGVTEAQVKTILAMSQQTAKGNITRKTPQITSLIHAVEQWLIEAT